MLVLVQANTTHLHEVTGNRRGHHQPQTDAVLHLYRLLDVNLGEDVISAGTFQFVTNANEDHYLKPQFCPKVGNKY